jgi:hypothetical protein
MGKNAPGSGGLPLPCQVKAAGGQAVLPIGAVLMGCALCVALGLL